MNQIVLGGGCFWCIEAVFQRVSGINKVVSGYAGGDMIDPNYKNHGNHAEVVRLRYDESIISLKKILDIFFHIHDPTTLNRQGNDIGPQYRSIILCAEDEIDVAENAKAKAQNLWDDPVVTEIRKLEKFYEAEEYHQDYYNKNPQAGYCQAIINPKIAKFESKFSDLLKN